MVAFRKQILLSNIKWHRWFAWIGGFALLCFALSGLLHPLMSWTGPKAKSFFPPQAIMKVEYAAAIPEILQKHQINQAIMIKVVPSENGAVLQVTDDNTKPRRYFDLDTHNELKDYDKIQAVWLARYYSGLKDTEVSNVKFQTEFNSAYPWVNRLLPVYEISFARDDNLKLFIYTELGALTAITNDYKTSLQTIFRALHTWNFLDDFDYARVLLMLVLLIGIFALLITAINLIFLMKSRRLTIKRKIHRVLSYFIWIPLLMFSISGTYHLLHFAYGDNHRGLKHANPVMLKDYQFAENLDWLDNLQTVKFNAISIVNGPDGNLLYRLSIPKGRPGQAISRQIRYDGMPIEKPALYFDAKTGIESDVTDREMAILYAKMHQDFELEAVENVSLITRFGPNYDFRNKRLPVWRIDIASDLGDKLFIDPATGMLVDRLVDSNRYEGYSFSFLHKWNFLTPYIGSGYRDIVIVFFISLVLLSTIFGFMMLWRKQKPN